MGEGNIKYLFIVHYSQLHVAISVCAGTWICMKNTIYDVPQDEFINKYISELVTFAIYLKILSVEAPAICEKGQIMCVMYSKMCVL